VDRGDLAIDDGENFRTKRIRIMSSETPSKVALVTGASSGIGVAVATHLLNDGYTVYGTSRKPEGPQSRTAGITMRALDVRDDTAVGVLVDDVVRNAGRIDLLVNNAGSQLVGALEETSLVEAKELFDVNFFGAVRATTAVLPHMRAARRGRIIFVSSVLGFLPAPFMGIYSATKHALEGYAETLDHEVRTFGIRSILVEPSFTATQLVKNQREASQRLPVYASMRAHVLQRFAEDTEHGDRPESVAATVLQAASATTPKLRYQVGQAKSLGRLRRFLPASMFEKSFRRRIALET
jgi:NAD(P)-dependent dehydrogenase (short-subunit alcohol dehydrogenase family)